MTDYAYPPIPAGEKIFASSKRAILYLISWQRGYIASGSGTVEDIKASTHFGQSFGRQLTNN